MNWSDAGLSTDRVALGAADLSAGQISLGESTFDLFSTCPQGHAELLLQENRFFAQDGGPREWIFATCPRGREAKHDLSLRDDRLANTIAVFLR
jgi:hypothetical protein